MKDLDRKSVDQVGSYVGSPFQRPALSIDFEAPEGALRRRIMGTGDQHSLSNLLDLKLDANFWPEETQETALELVEGLFFTLPGVPDPSKAMLIFAAAIGWNITITGTDAACMTSPDGKVKKAVPLRVLSEKEHRRLNDVIARHADKKLMEASRGYNPSVHAAVALGAADRIWTETHRAAVEVHCGLSKTHDAHRWLYMSVLGDDYSEEHKFTLEHAWCSGKKRDCISITLTPEAPMTKLLSEQPWMAHRGTGSAHRHPQAYPTRSTIERKWSDGSIDYRCSYDGCDFEHTGPRNVVTHFAAKHVRFGDLPTQSAPTELVDDPNFEGSGLTRKVKPRKVRIDALARFMLSLDPELTDAERSEQILIFLAELSNSGSAEAQEREPLTPEQVIIRIRALVDSGTFVQQQESIEDREMKILELEEELQSERLARENLEGSLGALRDLVRDILPDPTTIAKG